MEEQKLEETGGDWETGTGADYGALRLGSRPLKDRMPVRSRRIGKHVLDREIEKYEILDEKRRKRAERGLD